MKDRVAAAPNGVTSKITRQKAICLPSQEVEILIALLQNRLPVEFSGPLTTQQLCRMLRIAIEAFSFGRLRRYAGRTLVKAVHRAFRCRINLEQAVHTRSP